MDLDRIPLWRGDRVGLGQLWSDYSQYLYLPRLRDSSVLLGAVRDGVASLTWNPETFAYASAFDEAADRYTGLVAATHPAAVLDGVSVVVKPERAFRQFEADRQLPPEADDGAVVVGPTKPRPGTDETPGTHLPTHYFGRVTLGPVRLLKEMGEIAEAIVAQLSRADAEITVTVEIEATASKGFEDSVIRTVTENARTLKFDPHGGFEAD